MKIDYVNLSEQYRFDRKKLIRLIDSTLLKGNYVGGDEIDIFEKNIAKFCKTKYCVALNSGTDALVLALYALGVRRGDEVITTPNSFIASTAVIVHLGAIPVFVDVKPDQNIDCSQIENKITKKTKVIMAVHLTGRMCEMDKIMRIAKKYNLKVVEDAAQSIGSMFKDKKSGSYGDVGCFSAHPLKNLNALGDSGYLTTNSKKISDYIKDLRSHGMTNRNIVKNFGYVSRMDNLQAAILNFRLKNLKSIILKRRMNAELYFKYLNKNYVYFAEENNNEFNTYHTFVIQVDVRDKLRKYLLNKGIKTAIHYPIPIHLQPAAKKLNYKRGDFKNTEEQANRILTLPVHQFLKKNDVILTARTVNSFFDDK
jgi:dTDP-4-amino-4,6-dideoxygalactose transaminase